VPAVPAFALGSLVARLVGPAGTVLAGEPGARDVADALRRDGICFLPQLAMDAADLAETRACLRGKPVIDWYDGKTALNIEEPVPANFTKLGYRTADLVKCAPLLRIANSPLILDAVTRVLGARPTITCFDSWWTLGEHYVPGKAHFDDVYHRDVDDLRFLKLFVYLSDTGEKIGAHSFVRGSHNVKALTRRGPISDETVRQAFLLEDILTITGRAGTVFLENTFGIHRPLMATEGRRLIFSALFSLTPWMPRGLNQRSGGVMPTGLDPYVNRLLFRS
jgi:hypothetical protein